MYSQEESWSTLECSEFGKEGYCPESGLATTKRGCDVLFIISNGLFKVIWRPPLKENVSVSIIKAFFNLQSREILANTLSERGEKL
mmetsp:Transcript_11669/g.14502  ORF Transcript_11669/g.14502 Transcript_11669/m.14502 type:complete len:86 (-) Transcript_11669:209-466(-)